MRSTRQASGFTLVETIFSTLFIGVAVLAIVNLFPGAYLSIRKSEMKIQTDLIVKSILDEIRLVKFSEIDRDTESGKYIQSGKPYEPWEVDHLTYIPTVEIYQVPGTDPDVLKGVRVTIEYRSDPSDKTLFAFPPPAVYETYIHKLIR